MMIEVIVALYFAALGLSEPPHACAIPSEVRESSITQVAFGVISHGEGFDLTLHAIQGRDGRNATMGTAMATAVSFIRHEGLTTTTGGLVVAANRAGGASERRGWVDCIEVERKI